MLPQGAEFLTSGSLGNVGGEPRPLSLLAQGESPEPGALTLAAAGRVLPIQVSAEDFPGVLRAAADLAADLDRVCGVRPSVRVAAPGSSAFDRAATGVWVGTLGRHPAIDALVAQGRIDVDDVRGRRECWLTEIVEAPAPGIERALVIAGSDKRGSIYGIYALSQLIGVSPWYWWADVPVRRRDRLVLRPGRHSSPEPQVRYRGIFLNDEAPALSGWVREKFGDYNQDFYARVFELLLRLRANFLWPAMWGSAFNEDDPGNAALADHYGIVMGTSHHEPMLRAQQEWKRHGQGPWDYRENAEALRDFWRRGIERNKSYESVITLGMRGDGDMPMSAAEDVALLERVVADQRAILADQYGSGLGDIPQVWALYKEVQAYFEKGMRVPDDVTLLWCDDNWGNLRRLPTPAERQRSGGAGIYYHFDYVGGPRSYKWLCTVPISKIWEQLQLAWQHGADRLWIVNVGDLKPMEFATEFFLQLAWSPEAMTLSALEQYGAAWAAREFGPEHAAAIAGMIARSTKLNARRKPELLEPDTYSLVHYREAEMVAKEHRSLEQAAAQLHERLPLEAQAAFLQLVLYPIQACANLSDLYLSVGLNRLYAVQGRASTNALFERARLLFRRDAELARVYNEELSGGKWRHMMDQNHIGYSYWQQPVRSALPAVTELSLPRAAALGVAIEGALRAWPSDDPNQVDPALPALDVYDQGTRWIDVFNRGEGSLAFSVSSDVPWLTLSPERAELGTGLASEVRVEVGVDWASVPHGEHLARVSIVGSDGQHIDVSVPITHPERPRPHQLHGFVEVGRSWVGGRPASANPGGQASAGRLGGGYLSMEAEHFSRAVSDREVSWVVLPDHGRTLSAVTPVPVTAEPRSLGPDSPRLEYRIFLFSPGQLEVTLFLSPSLDFLPGRGLRCAVSFDADPREQLDIVASGSSTGWARAVEDSVRKLCWRHELAEAGGHDFKFWMIDPGVVLQKVVIDAGGARPCYLGPPESFRGPLPRPPTDDPDARG